MTVEQAGNLYTQIPNDLLNVVLSGIISPSGIRILLFIARKTYGFHKQSDQISITQFESRLSLSRKTVVKELFKLRLVTLVKLVKKGRSKKSSNDWTIDCSDYTSKLVTYSKLVTSSKPTKESITKEKEREEREKETEKPLKPENSLSYLLSVPARDLVELSKKYSANQDQIKQKADALYNWCVSNSVKKKNYHAWLSSRLNAEFGLRELPKFPEREGFVDAKTLRYH